MKKLKLPLLKVAAISAMSIPLITFATSCNNGEEEKKEKDVAILFTNDTHCTLTNSDTGLGWVGLKGYRNFLDNKGYDTLLVDSGDFAQGGVYGSISDGKYIVDLMNSCGYNLTIPGNHEFDYGMKRFDELRTELNCPMISSNFYHYDPTTQKETTPVLEPTAILNAGGKKIGFVGVSTPSSLRTSNPKNFQDDQGNFIYSFLSGETPEKFYSTIQNSIDSLHQQNVDLVIALTHLGIDDSEQFKDYEWLLNGIVDILVLPRQGVGFNNLKQEWKQYQSLRL